MKTKHTPAPWKAWNTGNGMGVCPEAVVKDALIPNAAAFRFEICRVKADPSLKNPEAWDKHWEEQKANANLIAAAPELYECAQGLGLILDMFETAAFKSIMEEPQFFQLVSQLRGVRKINNAAIAKAEGRL